MADENNSFVWVPSTRRVLGWMATALAGLALFVVTTYAHYVNNRLDKNEVQGSYNAQQIAVANTKLDLLLESFGIRYHPEPQAIGVVPPPGH